MNLIIKKTQKVKVINIRNILLVTFFSILLLTSCKDRDISYIVVDNKVYFDNKGVVELANFPNYEPKIYSLPNNQFLIFDGYRKIRKYDYESKSVIDSVIVSHSTKSHPRMRLSKDKHLIELGYNSSLNIIRTKDLVNLGKPYDTICRRFYKIGYEDYFFEISRTEYLSDSSLKLKLINSNIGDSLIYFHSGKLELVGD